MRYIIITICFLFVGGCSQAEPEYTWDGRPVEDRLANAYGAFYQMYGRPPFFYQPPAIYVPPLSNYLNNAWQEQYYMQETFKNNARRYKGSYYP